MRALIKQGIVTEITDAYVTTIYNHDYFESEVIAIEVTQPLTPRQLDFLRAEDVPDRYIEEQENKIFIFNPRKWSTEDAQKEADDRIECLLKNGFINLDDLLEI